MKEKETDRFEKALADKEIPLVILDNKWYQLFDADLRTYQLTSLEKKLTRLIQQQGQLYNDVKEMKLAKRTLMDKVLENMDGIEEEFASTLKEKKLDASQKLIRDLNVKIEKGEKELADLPAVIDTVNRKLLIEGMRICYHALKLNRKDMDAINGWIDSVRVETKKKMIQKQEIQEESDRMYSYMHDILGFQVVDAFDMFLDEASAEK